LIGRPGHTENRGEIVRDRHRSRRRDVGATGVAERVSPDDRRRARYDDPEQLPHDLATPMLVRPLDEHPVVGADMEPRERLADDVCTTEVSPDAEGVPGCRVSARCTHLDRPHMHELGSVCAFHGALHLLAGERADLRSRDDTRDERTTQCSCNLDRSIRLCRPIGGFGVNRRTDMRPSRRATTILTAILAGTVSVAAAAPMPAGAQTAPRPKVAALVASFDPYASAPQRFIVGLLTARGRQLAFGEVEFRFAYAGTKENPFKTVEAGPAMTATYRPVTGADDARSERASRVVATSRSRGVYGVDDVVFDRPGYWAVLVSGHDGTRRFNSDAVFEVAPAPRVAAPGSPAPRSENPLPGAVGVRPKSIDSRARGNQVPDPELHAESVATAIGRGRPTMVVVSTPVFCASQFCGPITDSIQALARANSDRMSFVHLEVWSDFQSTEVNNATGEWVFPREGGEANEPWVFVVDASGTIVQRFDNVATADELATAVERHASAQPS